MFKSIRALAIYVTDLKKAKRFYTEVLGFELSTELGPNLCFLKSKSGDIHIYMEGGKKQTSVDNQTSRLSFFLQAENSASETYAALKTVGVKILQEFPELVWDDTACFQFEDPDGNIIEVSGEHTRKMNRNRKSKGAQTPPYPSNADEWRNAIGEALNLTPEEGKARYQASTFPFDNLVSWIRLEFSADEGYSPDFVPALIRNIKGLVAWVYGEGLEPYWPRHDEH